jgi:N4-gp56 family major capsid protein
MSLANFVAAVWSARLMANLNKNLVFAQPGVINRDYEGEIREFGDQVKINAIGRITKKSYSKGVDIDTPEELDSSQTTLIVDQGDYYNFSVDDIDRVQARPDLMNGAMNEASYTLADGSDQYLAGLYAQVAAATTIGTASVPKADLGTASKAYDYLVDLGVLLDEQNVPSGGRWAIIPPWFHGIIRKDSRFVGYGTPAQDAVIRTGVVGEAAGFQLLKSNNVSNDATTWRIMAGHPMAWSYADQIVKTEAFRPERRFADAVKGLHLYGAKVTRPNALALIFANKPA